LVSCGLLLDTDPSKPGLTASSWVANNPYFDTTTKILDANLHVQQVVTAGTSGTYGATPFHPAWSTTGVTINDNAVIWTDGGVAAANTAPDWMANTAYCSACKAGTTI